MEKFITKTYKTAEFENGKRVYKTKSTLYRIDADFVPNSAKEICIEFCVNYCKELGDEHRDWLYQLMIDKKTALSTVKKLFIEKYFDNLVLAKKSKRIEMLELLSA